jgi:membrane-bound inhibitor of C-type lysozyme
MRLVPPKGPVAYACNDSFGEVIATFFETDPPTTRLERGDKTVTAWLVPAASGSKYEGPNVEFWTKGKEAQVTWLDEKLKCVSK